MSHSLRKVIDAARSTCVPWSRRDLREAWMAGYVEGLKDAARRNAQPAP